MKFSRPFTPAFLKKWDEYLLLNRPDTWSTRAHLVVYYCLLFMIALGVICFVVPNDPRLNSNVPIWVTFVSLLAFVGLIVWLIYLLRFNVFKRFGNLRKEDDVKTYLLYFLSIGMLVLTAYIPPVVETVRANQTYTSAELVSDVNAINTMVLQLEHNSVTHEWNKDSFIVVKASLNENRPSINHNDYSDDGVKVYNDPSVGSNGIHIIDTAELNEKYSSADSLVRINDSLYVNYECPDYIFISSNEATYFSGVKELTSADLYHKVLQNYHEPDKSQTLEAIKNIVRKYNPDLTNWMEVDYERREYLPRIKAKYGLYTTSYSIGNITRRKYRWDNSTINIVARVFYYVTMVLAILAFMFRRSSLRTFFLTLLSLILLSIITSLFFAFMGGDEVSSCIAYFVYFILFFMLAIAFGNNKVRSVFAGISLNLMLLLIPFFPLMGVACYYAFLDKIHRGENPYPYYLYKNQFPHLFYAEVGGFLLLLIMIIFFFREQYRLWFSQPEQ